MVRPHLADSQLHHAFLFVKLADIQVQGGICIGKGKVHGAGSMAGGPNAHADIAAVQESNWQLSLRPGVSTAAAAGTRSGRSMIHCERPWGLADSSSNRKRSSFHHQASRSVFVRDVSPRVRPIYIAWILQAYAGDLHLSAPVVVSCLTQPLLFSRLP